MVAQRVAPIANHVCEDTSVFPNRARSSTISDRETTSLPVNKAANYKILPTMNAGDAYEIYGCYNSPLSTTLNNAKTCLLLYEYVIQTKLKCTNSTVVENIRF
jgi:hypothetical protein